MTACDHMNTGFDPITRKVYCKDCGQTMATVKPKPGVKIPIKATKKRK